MKTPGVLFKTKQSSRQPKADMSAASSSSICLPPEQQAIRAKCFHPTGKFVEFTREEVEQSIAARFEKTVAEHPDRVAVKTTNCTLTYKTLNETANRIARAILALREGENEPVAVLLQKDATAGAAMLGALKAGKIYIAMDPSFPRERIVSMLEDSQAQLILTDTSCTALANSLANSKRQLLNIDAVDPDACAENSGLSVPPEALAHIVYTSGSTGEPKGVTQNHRMVLHNAMNITNAYHFCADDRASLLGSFSSGQAVTGIYTALLNGAALYLWNTKRDGLAGLAKWLTQEEITIYHSSATVFRSFIDTLSGDERFPKIRIVRLGSEPVVRKDAESYKKHFSQDCFLINALSLTEVPSICLNVMSKESRLRGDAVPVGYALEDREVLLLDDTGKQVGFDQTGEIAVRSRYLTPGYWGRPDLTEAKFLPDPEGGDKPIYLTGDLGRMMPDGCLEHIGRKDFQAKVRGYRIDLGGVEAAILAQENIKAAVVIATQDQSERKESHLVAYIVANAGPAPSTTLLRRALSEKLPDYMIPSRYVFLETLPQTPTGKIDRKALPHPGKSRPELDTPFATPRIPIEKELAGIWAEVLHLDPIGIYDNFFDLGGHSLAATQVVSRVIKKFQLELPLQSLFQSPTVAEMAAVIAEHQGTKLDERSLQQILNDLESLSEEEARRLLSDPK
jgi:amino acid adenylation domain-containing protein